MAFGVYAITATTVDSEGNPRVEVLSVVAVANITQFIYKLRHNPSVKHGVLAARLSGCRPRTFLISSHSSRQEAATALLPAILKYSPTCIERIE